MTSESEPRSIDGVTFRVVERCPWCHGKAIQTIARRADSIPVQRCTDCALVFTGELPDDLGVFYDDGYFARHSAPGSVDALTGYDDYDQSYSPSSFRWITTLLKCLVPEGGKLFDVGAATGTFLEMAAYEGFEVSGSEINATAAEQARSKGLDVVAGPFSAADWPAGGFDVVTALETLEHVTDVRSMLTDLAALLNETGILCFLVPNVPARLVDEYGDDLIEFTKSLEHTFYFNPEILAAICEDVFGAGRLTLATMDVSESGQIVSYAFGIVRKEPVEDPPEAVLIPLVSGAGSLEELVELPPDHGLAVALGNAKFFQFDRADAALLFALDGGVSEDAHRVVKAQVLRNKGELFSSMHELESVLARQNTDPFVASLLAEILRDFWSLLGATDRGLSAGARQVHGSIEATQRELAGYRSRAGSVELLGAERVEAIEMANHLAEANAAQREELEALISTLREQAASLEEEILRMGAGLKEVAQENGALTIRLRESEAALLEARQTVATHEARTEVLRRDVDRFKADLDGIYDSRAWRAVSALRTAKGNVFGFLGWPVRQVRRFWLRRLPVADHGEGPLESAVTGVRPSPVMPSQFPVLVSVIMPVYNKGRGLLDAVDSVLRQTLQDVEIIVWDDGSTDPETEMALQEAARLSRVSLFRSSNRGVIGARNAAMSFARGRYFCCLDPDDRIAPTYLEKAVVLLEADPRAAIAYPWQETIGDKTEIWKCQDLDPRLIATVNHVPVCAVFRREVYVETGGFSSEMTSGYEDWEFWAHAAELGFAGRAIPEPLFEYTHSASADESRDARAREMHLELATRIAELHPLLARGGVVTRQESGYRSRQLVAAQTALPAGVGRPIVLTIPWLTVGGADNVVESLVRHWVSDGRTVVVMATVSLGAGMLNRFDQLLDLTPYAYQLPALLPEDEWLGFVGRHLEILTDPVLVNIGSPWLYTVVEDLKRRMPGLRVVDQQFNDLGHLEGNRSASAAIDVTAAAYDALAEVLRADGRPPESVQVVYTGIEQPAQPDAEAIAAFRSENGPDKILVSFVGRLSEEKRPGWIVEVADALGTDYHLLAVGDGPLADELGPEIASRKNITWVRHAESIETVLASSDVVMLPSRVEGIPLVVLEALALATPVVAAAVGGLPELAGSPGITLVDPNDLDGFVRAIRRIEPGAEAIEGGLLPQFREDVMMRRFDQLVDPGS
ncbi:MAG: glycosyltransferase [Acidimicrobiia bacterium]|nr:glycosyltransferase [Acidimicrobiia bacterium]